MKKTILFLSIAASLILLCSCTASTVDTDAVNKHNPVDNIDNTSPIANAEAVLKAKIIKIYDGCILVSSEEGDANSNDIYIVSINSDLNLNTEKLQPGDIIEVGYNGLIMETYPAQLGETKYINFIEKKDDLVGFYENVFAKLFEVDSGLNDGIDILAFDLSKTTNLSDIEKNALIYVLGNKYSLESMAGTFDELCESGYIDKEKLYFEKGLLVSFEVTSESKNSFMFNAQKWRGGLGAYFFQDCKANKTKNGWEFKIGSEAIS